MDTPLTPISPAPPTKTNILSIISLIAGILGFLSMCLGIIPVLWWFCYGAGGLLSIAALVLGFLGIKQIKKTGERGRGLAITGIVLGGLTILGVCGMIIFTLTAGPIVGNIFSNINNNLIVP